jgi:hypothetical protein
MCVFGRKIGWGESIFGNFQFQSFFTFREISFSNLRICVAFSDLGIVSAIRLNYFCSFTDSLKLTNRWSHFDRKLVLDGMSFGKIWMWCGHYWFAARWFGSTSLELRQFPPTWPFWALWYVLQYFHGYRYWSLYMCIKVVWLTCLYSNRLRVGSLPAICIFNIWQMSIEVPSGQYRSVYCKLCHKNRLKVEFDSISGNAA